MSCEELEQLYCRSCPGPAPNGTTRGVAIRYAGTDRCVRHAKITGILWHGKQFDACAGTLLNRWCLGVKAIKAQVYCGESWLDGKPSLIMDYSETSHVWRKVRDELRQVCPGLYLGVMYERKDCEPKFKMFFALEVLPSCE
jgi:hypothetical protein